MKVFDDIMDTIRGEMDEMLFHEILRQSRDRLGIMQYRAAEFLGLPIARLKNLETGYYRAMPTEKEMTAICNFYEVPKELMEEKALTYVRERRHQAKVRIFENGAS